MNEDQQKNKNTKATINIDPSMVNNSLVNEWENKLEIFDKKMNNLGKKMNDEANWIISAIHGLRRYEERLGTIFAVIAAVELVMLWYLITRWYVITRLIP